MPTKTINVKLVGKKKGYYLIAFPKLSIPVEVDETLYQKMKYSKDYSFIENSNTTSRTLALENQNIQ